MSGMCCAERWALPIFVAADDFKQPHRNLHFFVAISNLFPNRILLHSPVLAAVYILLCVCRPLLRVWNCVVNWHVCLPMLHSNVRENVHFRPKLSALMKSKFSAEDGASLLRTVLFSEKMREVYGMECLDFFRC